MEPSHFESETRDPHFAFAYGPIQSSEPGTEHSLRGIFLRPISPPVSEHHCILGGHSGHMNLGFMTGKGGMVAVERKVSVSVETGGATVCSAPPSLTLPGGNC